MNSPLHQAIILITGIQAAGKSTIAQLLAERLPRSVHVRGDLFRRMVINGRDDMTPDPSEEAVRQLRHRLTLDRGRGGVIVASRGQCPSV
ncbi:AAA family ATPase [Nocardia mangyaensis]|uniref:AAA family ATPase n=1 Tax=Nocardia mangyaensis TaxID=2213200 RepID=UPI00197CDD05|nr:AAA family ATPase [Nocardia mangyaensis]